MLAACIVRLADPGSSHNYQSISSTVGTMIGASSTGSRLPCLHSGFMIASLLFYLGFTWNLLLDFIMASASRLRLHRLLLWRSLLIAPTLAVLEG